MDMIHRSEAHFQWNTQLLVLGKCHRIKILQRHDIRIANMPQLTKYCEGLPTFNVHVFGIHKHIHCDNKKF